MKIGFLGIKHVLCKGFSSKFRSLNLLSILALLFVKNQKYLLQMTFQINTAHFVFIHFLQEFIWTISSYCQLLFFDRGNNFRRD